MRLGRVGLRSDDALPMANSPCLNNNVMPRMIVSHNLDDDNDVDEVHADVRWALNWSFDEDDGRDVDDTPPLRPRSPIEYLAACNCYLRSSILGQSPGSRLSCTTDWY